MRARYTVSKRRIEDRAIHLLRAASAAFAEDSPFASLASVARRAGLSILAVGAPYISTDETIIIGALAGYQRQWGDRHILRGADFAPVLALCAEELTTRGIRLPYIAMQRSGFVTGRRINSG